MPATIGIIAASDRMAMIALSEMIERTFIIVGNVSRQKDAEQEREQDRQDDEAVDRHEPLDALEAAQARKLAAGRLERRRFDRRSHCLLLCRVRSGDRRRVNQPFDGKRRRR